MRAAIVTHVVGRGDGQGRVNDEVAQALLRRGHRVDLLATHVDADLAERDGVTWHRVPPSRLPTALLRNQAFAWRTAARLRRHRPGLDAVLLNGAITWAPGDLNAAHMVHSAWLRSPAHTARVRRGPYAWYQWLYTAWNARWERRAFAEAGLVVAVSEAVRDQVLALGLEAHRVRVIPNGVDLQEFRPGPADRHDLPVPEGAVTALFAGDLQTSRKNLDTVLHALVDVPGLHLLVAGATDGSPYPALAGRLGLDGRVHFLGYRRDVPRLMRAADLFVLPTRYEPFGLVLVEALATGLPVVTARTAGAAPIVEAAGGTVLDDPDDVAALARALQTLAADAELRARLGTRARAAAEAHGFGRMAEQYADLIEAAAARRAAA